MTENKVINFPKKKKVIFTSSYNKHLVANFILSFSSLIIGLAIVWFILHRLNV